MDCLTSSDEIFSLLNDSQKPVTEAPLAFSKIRKLALFIAADFATLIIEKRL
jgi:hypothetical protein